MWAPHLRNSSISCLLILSPPFIILALYAVFILLDCSHLARRMAASLHCPTQKYRTLASEEPHTWWVLQDSMNRYFTFRLLVAFYYYWDSHSLWAFLNIQFSSGYPNSWGFHWAYLVPTPANHPVSSLRFLLAISKNSPIQKGELCRLSLHARTFDGLRHRPNYTGYFPRHKIMGRYGAESCHHPFAPPFYLWGSLMGMLDAIIALAPSDHFDAPTINAFIVSTKKE